VHSGYVQFSDTPQFPLLLTVQPWMDIYIYRERERDICNLVSSFRLMARTILVILAVAVCLASALSTPKIKGSWPIKQNTSPQLDKYDHGSLVGAIGVGDVGDG